MLQVTWVFNRPLPGVVLEWRGPNLITSEWVRRQGLTTLEDIPTKIAVISGPRGEKGEPGITTIVTEAGELPLLDGGNF